MFYVKYSEIKPQCIYKHNKLIPGNNDECNVFRTNNIFLVMTNPNYAMSIHRRLIFKALKNLKRMLLV